MTAPSLPWFRACGAVTYPVPSCYRAHGEVMCLRAVVQPRPRRHGMSHAVVGLRLWRHGVPPAMVQPCPQRCDVSPAVVRLRPRRFE